jgi:Fe-S cluster biogenesis protein NfuA
VATVGGVAIGLGVVGTVAVEPWVRAAVPPDVRSSGPTRQTGTAERSVPGRREPTITTGGNAVDTPEVGPEVGVEVGVEVELGDPQQTEAAPTLSDDERGERLSQLNGIIELMRPAVQADGGDLALLSADVVTGVVEVQLQGACSSCAVSASTLQGGVDRILRDRLPWVTEVLGGVDESVDPFESESMGRGGYVPSF